MSKLVDQIYRLVLDLDQITVEDVMSRLQVTEAEAQGGIGALSRTKMIERGAVVDNMSTWIATDESVSVKPDEDTNYNHLYICVVENPGMDADHYSAVSGIAETSTRHSLSLLINMGLIDGKDDPNKPGSYVYYPRMSHKTLSAVMAPNLDPDWIVTQWEYRA